MTQLKTYLYKEENAVKTVSLLPVEIYGELAGLKLMICKTSFGPFKWQRISHVATALQNIFEAFDTKSDKFS